MMIVCVTVYLVCTKLQKEPGNKCGSLELSLCGTTIHMREKKRQEENDFGIFGLCHSATMSLSRLFLRTNVAQRICRRQSAFVTAAWWPNEFTRARLRRCAPRSVQRLSTTTDGPQRPADIPDHVDYVDKTQPRPKLDPADYPTKVPVRMPDMGEGGGKILQWYKQPGDVVLRDDVLCDIETVDFVFGMETDDEHPAIMGEILVEAPSKEIKDDEIICFLLHPSSSEEEDAKGE